jgi:hypothetical protein
MGKKEKPHSSNAAKSYLNMEFVNRPRRKSGLPNCLPLRLTTFSSVHLLESFIRLFFPKIL